MRARTNAQIVAETPVVEIVPALASGPREGRRLVVQVARRVKRGSGAVEMVLDDVPEFTTIAPEDLLAVDHALTRLAEIDPRAGRIVELRFFVGLTGEEVADVMGISEKTVKRDWGAAKSWLRKELRSAR
jgi:RNA polymerase sigma factor (TIGR02999 family)